MRTEFDMRTDDVYVMMIHTPVIVNKVSQKACEQVVSSFKLVKSQRADSRFGEGV